MRILKIAYENIGLFNDGFEVDLIATDKVVDDSQVFPVYNSIYKQNVMGFVGINATGKTSTLKLIDVALDIVLDHRGLDDLNIPKGIIGEETVLKVYFFYRNAFYKFIAMIGLKGDANGDANKESSYYFRDEIVYQKNKSMVTSRKNVFEFAEDTMIMQRSKLDQEKRFLKPQDSMITAITIDHGTIHYDMLWDTNFNVLFAESPARKEFVKLFDSGIESIKVDEKKTFIRFKNSEKEVVSNHFAEAHEFLSSGTIKGINLFNRISQVMKQGGYLIVDEIENHLHKKLVQAIISMFEDGDVNRNGATLIFSTHYTEIIDAIDRKDNIYILRKKKDHFSECVRYSDEISRNDIKKSEVLLANLIEGTVPRYEDIQRVRDFLCL